MLRPEAATDPCDRRSQDSLSHRGLIFAAGGRHGCLWAEPTRFDESNFPPKIGRMVTLRLDIFLPQVWMLDAPEVCCWTLSESTRFYESQGVGSIEDTLNPKNAVKKTRQDLFLIKQKWLVRPMCSLRSRNKGLHPTHWHLTL